MTKSSGWGVVGRLADGRQLYRCPPTSRRGGQDQWSPRVTQAARFNSREEAERVASEFETNAAAKQYLVVRI
jgi:hypothetical protein